MKITRIGHPFDRAAFAAALLAVAAAAFAAPAQDAVSAAARKELTAKYAPLLAEKGITDEAGR